MSQPPGYPSQSYSQPQQYQGGQPQHQQQHGPPPQQQQQQQLQQQYMQQAQYQQFTQQPVQPQYAQPQQQQMPPQQPVMQQPNQAPLRNHHHSQQQMPPSQQPPPQQNNVMIPPQADAPPLQETTPQKAGSGTGTARLLTKAQLSPPPEQVQKIKSKLQALFQNRKDGPNLGFTPTPRMATQHEKRPPLPNDTGLPLYKFQVTKLRSWRTGYVRLLVLHQNDFCTLDTEESETNRWPYTALTEWQAIGKDDNTILLKVNNDILKFSCHDVHRAHVLTALLQCSPNQDMMVCRGVERYTRHGTTVAVQLHVKSYGVVEVCNGAVTQTYRFVDLAALTLVEDDERGVVLHFRQPFKTRVYLIPNRHDFCRGAHEGFAALGLVWDHPLPASTTLSNWVMDRRKLPIGTVVTCWPVRKLTARHDCVSRQIALTGGGFLVERDSAGIVSCRKLLEIASLIRHGDNDGLTVEYVDGSHRTYYGGSSRDALLVAIWDACSAVVDPATKQRHHHVVHVADVPTAGYCLASFGRSNLLASTNMQAASSLFQPISIAELCLQRVYTMATQVYAYISYHLDDQIDLIEQCSTLVEACREFNASILPTAEGLPNNKTVTGCVGALWGLVAGLLSDDQSVRRQETVSALLQTLYRLSRTEIGYKMSAELTTLQEAIPFLFQGSLDVFGQFWALQVLNVLVSGLPQKRDLEAEYVNKNVVLKCGGPSLVQGIVSTLVGQRISDLILMGASNVLQNILCSFHDTTSPEHFSNFIQALAERYRGLLSTLRSQTPCVIENTALLLHLLSSHAPATARSIRDEALSSAIILQHFYLAIFSPMEGQRFLSRYLCSMWFSGSKDCDEKRLLRRMVPHGFLTYLGMPLLSQIEEEQLDELERDCFDGNVTLVGEDDSSLRGASGTNTARLRSRITLAAATASVNGEVIRENFRIFFHVLTQDHNLPDLIWSRQTRRELRIALEGELAYVKRETESRTAIAWNHQQFRVPYPSLENEVEVGHVYMRLWLEAGDGFIRSWEEPLRLFEHLFRRFLCEIDRNEQVTNMVIRCLEKLYAVHAAKIGTFTDVMILARTMTSTKSIETQHRLLGLLATVLGVGKDDGGSHPTADIPENAEQLLNNESISQLCQFVAWGHTEPAQVGNMLSRALSVGATKRALITDGSGAGPSSSTRGSVSGTTNDSVCPAVWYVASTGKIPPSADLVRGPFRVSDLVRMTEEGNLSPYDLVTTSHVEEYEVEDETADTIAEAQIDTGKWKRLNEVWQLRWTLCTDTSGTSILAPADVALLALRALTRLVDLHKSLDSRGVPYLPIPIAKRILTGAYSNAAGLETEGNPLATLSQAMLCNNADLVSHAADLIYKVTRYNERATQKLYLTGAFFFACCYTGSNFKSLARLLHATHLEQQFRSGFAAAANEDELPMRERSVLGQILPEGLLFILVNYGAERFAEIFVGSADTPEVIWTFEMRKHLIEMVHQHLGDFPLRLFQNNSTEYEYCPMPGVAYKRLEKEIFCHNYYLHNLCDEVRFPDWPIAEPVEVFRACLERFKKQLDGDASNTEESLEDARQVLELKEGDGSRELRKAYRKLARVYHPDKNPSGRDMFESIQTSYELLLPLLETGEKIRIYAAGVDLPANNHGDGKGKGALLGERSHMETMQLLIKAQLLICRRYESEMSRYKYPAYSVLLSCLEIPDSCKPLVKGGGIEQFKGTALLRADTAAFIFAGVELVFRTCLVSPLNSEELVAEAGVPALASLLSFYVSAICAAVTDGGSPASHFQGACASLKTMYGIVTFLLRTLSGIAFYENGRDAIKGMPGTDGFILDMRRCMDGSMGETTEPTEEDMQMKRFALEGFVNMAKDEVLQKLIIGCGVVWPTLRCALSYDPTLETSSSAARSEVDDIGFSVASSNTAARHAIRTLGILSGALEGAPANLEMNRALSTLLTNPIALMLRNKRTSEILRVLNSNVETADIIWNVSMRKQLDNFVKTVEKERPDVAVLMPQEELQPVENFEYDSLKHEVRIGGVYMRVFNKHGKDSLGRISNPTAFFVAVTNFLARCLNSAKVADDFLKIPIDGEDDESTLQNTEITGNAFLLAIKALLILCRVEGLVDGALEDSPAIIPATLLSLLELPLESEAFDIGAEAVSITSARQAFASSVAKEDELWRLVQILERPDSTEGTNEPSDSHAEIAEASKRKVLSWSVLEALSSSPDVALQIVSSGVWFELLGVLVGYSEFSKAFQARSGAAKTLSRLLWDPSTGPAIAENLSRFLPPTLIVKLKEGPEAMLEAFDTTSDTPELIWDGSMRAELRKTIGGLLDACLASRTRGGDKSFKIPPNARAHFAVLAKELFIGGVYVSRFLKEPAYNLRDPTAFLEHLLQRWTKEFDALVNPMQAGTASMDSSVIAEAEEDILTTVTTACVYVCKVRDALCDKLAEWGYMAKMVSYLDVLLERNLVGAPLLSVVRLLHVASGRIANVEALALIGQGDTERGIVRALMRSINSEPLHPDTAFIVEILKRIFEAGLGDLRRAGVSKMTASLPSHHSHIPMGPSAAPGEGPTRKKVDAWDDPLGMMGQVPPSAAPSAVPVGISSSQGRNVGVQNAPGYGNPAHSTGVPQGGYQQYSNQSQPLSSNYSAGPQNTLQSSPSSYQQRSLAAQQAQQTSSHGYQYQAPGNRASAQGMYGTMNNQFQQPAQMMQQQQMQQPTGAHHQAPSAFPQSGYQPQNQVQPQSFNGLQGQAGWSQPQQLQQGTLPSSPYVTGSRSTQARQGHQTGPPHSVQQPMQPGFGLQQQPSSSGNFGVHSAMQFQQQRQEQPQQQPPQQQQPQQQRQPNDPRNFGYGQSIPQQYQFQPGNEQAQSNPLVHGGTPLQHPTSAPQVQTSTHSQPPFNSVQSSRANVSSGQLYAGVPMYPPPGGPTSNLSQTVPSANAPPLVETVQEVTPATAPQYRPTAVEGSGIDARTKDDPNAVAQMQAVTMPAAPGAAQGRVALLQQALSCQLCEFLVDKVLENQELSKVRDTASTKVHTIELLKMLTKDPGYGPKFKLILSGIPAWAKYKSQDHSLLITGHEQKADYFLTDGSSGEKKLLTSG